MAHFSRIAQQRPDGLEQLAFRLNTEDRRIVDSQDGPDAPQTFLYSEIPLKYSGLSDINDLSQLENYTLFLNTKKEDLLKQITAAKLVVEEKRKLYIEAHKELKVLENLKEKAMNEYKKNVTREQDNVLDDIINTHKY